jgi:signal transduction histidine kinase
MMTQVCDNLLANAIKFAPKGEVRISLYNHDGHAVLEVSDNGIGIPADKIPNIFKRFYQVNADTKRRFGGSGIGLAVVKQVTDLHGGVIEVESEESRGSTFKVYLKLASEEP